MDSKKEVLKKLGQNKLGKKTQIVGYKKTEKGTISEQNNIGEEIILFIKRAHGDMGFVVGRWDNETQTYGVAYDPEAHLGRIISIVNGYEPVSEDEDKPKK